jgi:FkbM family methyltransferase
MMLVDTRDLSLAPSLILWGEWERDTEAALKRITRPGAIVADIGANFGYHTLTLAKAAGPGGKVYAFEANPELVAMLRDTLMINGLSTRVEIHNLAILDKTGPTELCLMPGYMGGGHIVHDNGQGYQDRQTIPGSTLPDALPHVDRLDVLRLDIEGTEPLALRGAERIIRNSPDIHIIAEWSVPMLQHRCDLPAFIEWLCGMGMNFRRVGKGGTLSPVRRGDLASLPHCDVLISRR